MYDYGNARVAALRGRLLGRRTLRRLAEAESAEALLALLEREEDWRPITRALAPLGADAQGAVEGAIERHRSARLGALPPMYQPPARPLVEALVMPLDRERVLSLVRRRLAGEAPDLVGATIVGGALLGAAELGTLTRSADLAGLVRRLVADGFALASDVKPLMAEIARGSAPDRLETGLAAAIERAREARVSGRGRSAALVRAILVRERADRAVAVAAIGEIGAAGAALLERTATLARLDELARAGPRDPLGIGSVAGYVAAVEAQAIRLRAILARVGAGWSDELVGQYLAVGRA